MKEKKTIIITIIIAVVVAVILIAVFYFSVSNGNNNGSVDTNDTSSSEENKSTENTPSSTTPDIEIDNAKNAAELDRRTAEIAEADPIYEYMQDISYETDTYKLIIGVDGNTKETYLIILINTSEPKTAIARADAEIYKNQALQQIRDWGIDPNNYEINVAYRY